MLSIIFLGCRLILKLIAKLHECIVHSVGIDVNGQFAHRVINVVETFELRDPRQGLDLEILLATLGEHLFLFLSLCLLLLPNVSLCCDIHYWRL